MVWSIVGKDKRKKGNIKKKRKKKLYVKKRRLTIAVNNQASECQCTGTKSLLVGSMIGYVSPERGKLWRKWW